MGTTGDMVGSAEVGYMVGANDWVGDCVGNAVGSMGAGVCPARGDIVGLLLGTSVGLITGLAEGGGMTGLWVGGGTVGDPVGTSGHGRSCVTTPYKLNGVQGSLL